MMKRRDFITLVSGAAAWPLAARTQQPAMPVVGLLYAGSAARGASFLAAFRRSLGEAGYVEGQTVTIEYRYANGQYDKLPELAAELVRRQVSVIVSPSNSSSARAVKAATTTIPIVFSVGEDPTKLGLVASLNRPGGNATGVNFFINELAAKRMELLRELLPGAQRFGALVNPDSATAGSVTSQTTTAASALGLFLDLVQARDVHEIEAAFTTLADKRSEALIVLPDTFFASRRVQITTLAARYAIPAIYTVRDYVEVGGLVSYGTNVTDVFRQLGVYTARILEGAKPADLPVVQSSKFEFVINLPTARALGLDVPPTLLALADEVIE
jgi:putative tryptophan/tyrosine transport system substrate-binding protein